MQRAQAASLKSIVDDLLLATGASRATCRLCMPDGSADLVAEALAEGVDSMGTQSVPGIVEAPTYQFLINEQELLIQNDCRTAAVAPPATLVSHYRVFAQMLAPVIIGTEMVATISVHEQDRTRDWTNEEIAALGRAQAAITALLSQEETYR